MLYQVTDTLPALAFIGKRFISPKPCGKSRVFHNEAEFVQRAALSISHKNAQAGLAIAM